jgi:hypothetical protein
MGNVAKRSLGSADLFKAGHMPFPPPFDCTIVCSEGWNIVAVIIVDMTAYPSSIRLRMHPAIPAGDLI